MHIDNEGSLTLEAALIFPFFILVIAFFFSILKSAIGWFAVRSALYNVADKMGAYSYLYEVAGLDKISAAVEEEDTSDLDLWLKRKAYQVSVNVLGAQLEKELLKESLKDVNLSALGIRDGFQGLSFAGTKIFCDYRGRNALLLLEVSYYPSFMGMEWIRGPQMTVRVISHPFLGKDPFESDDKNGSEVYRIGSGDKYHILSCYLIDKDISEYSLLEAQNLGLAPCKRCRAWESSRVFASRSGECYHSGECSYLYPELTAMSEQEAKDMGLEPCLICIKEGGWFEGNR